MACVECVICQDDDRDAAWASIPCGHVFHMDCLTTALGYKPECPNCKDPCQQDQARRLYLGSGGVPRLQTKSAPGSGRLNSSSSTHSSPASSSPAPARPPPTRPQSARATAPASSSTKNTDVSDAFSGSTTSSLPLRPFPPMRPLSARLTAPSLSMSSSSTHSSFTRSSSTRSSSMQSSFSGSSPFHDGFSMDMEAMMPQAPLFRTQQRPFNQTRLSSVSSQSRIVSSQTRVVSTSSGRLTTGGHPSLTIFNDFSDP